jgi:FkbM family methyltransferase
MINLLKKLTYKFCLSGLKLLSDKERLEVCISGLRLLSDRDLLAAKERLGIVRELDYSSQKILLNVESEFELDNRLLSCRKEAETVEWIETYIRDGDVLYDIGANVGAYSLVASKFTNKKARIYAFEPGFPTFAQLSTNILLNNCQDSITPLQIALSSSTKLDSLNYNNLTSGGALHALGEAIDYAGEPFTPVLRQYVISYRIDDLIKDFGIPVPNHIKLDVDGTELEILKGAPQTLADSRLRTLLLEINEDLTDFKDNILSCLRESGMHFHAKYGHPRNLFNYVFIRESR